MDGQHEFQLHDFHLTEQQWLSSTDAIDLIHHLSTIGRLKPTDYFSETAIRASERKLRLFGAACCRRVQHWNELPVIEDGIEAAERFADGEGNVDELARLQKAAEDVGYPRRPSSDPIYHTQPLRLARAVSLLPRFDDGWVYYNHIREVVRETADDGDVQVATANFMREIYGNPFRPVIFNPAWRTSDAILLAQGIYDDRAFDRMPILADALQDAGCGSEDILSHCRDAKQAHVRGCWVVDLVLGKE